MRKFNYLNIYGIILLLVLITSCSDNDSNLYDGPDFVAFLGQSSNVLLSENGDATTLNLGITQPQNEDVTITLSVNDDTAVVNEHYTISSTSVVIPAGEYNTTVSITPIDDDAFNQSRAFTIEITSSSAGGLEIGNFDEISFLRTVVIANDDCPTQSNLWWGSLSVEDVGFGFLPGTGSANASGDCDVLVVTSDLPNAGVGAAPFELFLTPSSLGATNGTVDVPSQLYCTNCSAGLDAFYSATGTYDEATESIVLFYSLDRSDGANFYTGTNVITPQ